MIFSFNYLIFMLPALILSLWAQFLVSSRYKSASQKACHLSGAEAARKILDSAGLQSVKIEMIGGHLSDHYDPTKKVLRLSEAVYQGHTLAAVGVAAHEAGHAIQDATRYPLMALRQMAVPMASIGSSAGIWIIIAGAVLHSASLFLAGIILFSAVALFQVINLPVEYNASARAKALLPQLGILTSAELPYVKKMLGACALTYVAATLSSILQVLWFVMRFAGSRD